MSQETWVLGLGLSLICSVVLHKAFVFFGLFLHVYKEGMVTDLDNLYRLFKLQNFNYLHTP